MKLWEGYILSATDEQIIAAFHKRYGRVPAEIWRDRAIAAYRSATVLTPGLSRRMSINENEALMSHSNPTIAQVMRQVMIDVGDGAITRADADLLDECAHRCAHTNLMSVRRTERARRIFQALDLSALFFRDKARGPSGWRVEYRLLESVDGKPEEDEIR